MGYFSWLYDYIFLIIWYSVEFTANICVILYVAHTFGYWKTPPPKQDVPATFDKTLKDTQNIFSAVGDVAVKLKGAFNEAAGSPVPAGQVGKLTREQKLEILKKTSKSVPATPTK